MPLWGKLNQSVSANSTTTRETSQGAPMNVHGLVSGKGGFGRSPMTPNSAFGNTSPGSAASIDSTMYQNTSSSVFNYQKVVGIFGVTANQMTDNTNQHRADQPAHAGWVVRRGGTGPIVKLGYTGTATGYNNTDVLTCTSPSGSANNNAIGSISTNSTGGALVLTITNQGRDFNMTNNSVTVANSTGGASSGSGATFFATAGGRAGRVHNETLVAMGSIVPGTNSAIYPANT